MSNIDKDKIIADLKAENSVLKSVLYKIPGNVYWKSKEDVYLGCNNNVAKLLGLKSPEEIVGKRGVDLLPSALVETIHKNDQEVIVSQKEVSIIEQGTDPEGKSAVYLSRKSPYYDNNKQLAGVIGISVDITKQKEIEEKLKKAKRKAEASNQAKSRFLAMVSHELRIPLTSLLGFSVFLQENQLTSEDRYTYTQQLIRSADYLLALVNKLLDFSKLEAGKVTVHSSSVGLKELVLDVKSMLESLAKNKKLDLELEYNSAIPEYVMIDKNILKQILINLVGNAIKFTEKGRVLIKVELLEKIENKVKIKFTVQDTGIGIPTNKIKNIFKEFYQVEDIYVRKTSITGVGLGLSIIKKLVKCLGSKIDVVSKINAGSGFSFTLELEIAKSSQNKLDVKTDTTSVNVLKGSRILLVEDEPFVQFVHKKMLTDLGCEVDVVGDAKSTLSTVNMHHDLIFVDIGLPDMNGFDLIKKLKNPSNQYHKIPVVALTGFFTDEEKERCLKAGAEEVIIKPASQEQLKQALLRYIN